MRNTDFQERLSDINIPAYIRNKAELALSTLRQKGDGTIEVSKDEFYLICKHANVKPIVGAMFTFIRITDELDNSVDIQLKTGLFETLGEAFKPAFYPNHLGNI